MVAHAIPPTDYDDEIPESEVISRLVSKDLRKAAETMTHKEAGYMVSLYYDVQDLRKASQNRQRAALEDRQPNELMHWTAKAQLNIESVIQSAMEKYTDNHELTRWAKSICGIGPVLSAGLMAHLGGGPPPPTVGHWWSFAGLNPDTEWRGREGMDTIVRTAYAVDGSDPTAITTIAATIKKYPEVLYRAGGVEPLSRITTREKLIELGIPEDVVKQCFRERPFELGAAVRHTCEVYGIPIGEAYSYLYHGVKLDKDAMIKMLVRRPWNAKLKVLCAYKIGESFVKVQGNPKDIYGKVYKARKLLEIERNDKGQYKDQADVILATRNFRRDTVARAAYQEGRLPDAHIHARARRKAVRLFLSHFHEVAYFLHFGTMPPNPYALEYLGHVHRIFAPNAHLIPGLEEAQEATKRKMGLSGV